MWHSLLFLLELLRLALLGALRGRFDFAIYAMTNALYLVVSEIVSEIIVNSAEANIY